VLLLINVDKAEVISEKPGMLSIIYIEKEIEECTTGTKHF